MDRTDAPPPGGTNFNLGAFVRAAAHDMAGQLNAISMNAELAKMLLQRPDVARAEEAITRLLSDCGRYGRMVRALERFGSAMTPHEREKMKVAELIDAAKTIYVQERSGSKPEFEVDAGNASV